MKIKVKYQKGRGFGNYNLKQLQNGDWIDLFTPIEINMARNEFRMIPLGVAMELPKGYEALVVPRSSTFKRYGIILVNSIGVIDESYNGDNDYWMFPAYSLLGSFIPEGSRIAQFRIIKHQPEIEFEEVETLDNENRGGFGSTGR